VADEPNRSHLPASVRAAGERADELIRQQHVDPAANPATPPAGTVAGPPADGGTPDAGTGPQSLPNGATAPSPPAVEPPPASPEDWEQKYRTLQGKYDAEREQERQRALNAERQHHQNVARVDPPAPAPTVPGRAKVELTDDEIVNAGPELIEIIRKAARAELQGDLEELDRLRSQAANIDNRFKQTEQSTEALNYQRFLDRLDGNPSGIKWRDLQTEPEFRDFIMEADRYSGRPRQALLTEAANSLDTNRVLAFYEDYLATRTGRAQTPVTPAPTPAVRLETQLSPTPGAGSSPAASSRPTGRIWSRSDIQRFYTDRQKGVFNGTRRQEGIELERDLFDAEREGRIT
jgi:hypothetical protein